MSARRNESKELGLRRRQLGRKLGILTILLSTSLVWTLSSDCIQAASAGSGGLKIAATIFPVADMAKQVAGDKVHVITILPAGASPHTYELTPKAVKELEGVRAVLVIGHGLDDWMNPVLEGVPETIPVDQGINLIRVGGETDPHYWLSLDNSKVIARNVAQLLSRLDPSNKLFYEDHLERYLSRLDQADQTIRGILSLEKRAIVTVHDGWRYFAKDYGLQVIGSMESDQEGEPTPKRLVRLAEKISDHNIKVLFSEPTVSEDLLRSFARDLHLRVYELDPLGATKHENFIDLMMSNARLIQEALSHD